STFSLSLNLLSVIKAANGVVLATEKKQKSILYDERSVDKVEPITKHIGLVYSGMGPDYGVLVHRARKLAQQYYLVYQEPIPTAQLVQRVASVMQEYTQSGGVRPFGVSLLICGWNEGRPYLFQLDPSGAYFAWKATAMGKNYVNGKTFLEKRYNEDLELEDAIHTAILTLKESFEGQMTEDNIEVGIYFGPVSPDYFVAVNFNFVAPVQGGCCNIEVAAFCLAFIH
uniref:Proteasome 20S subunit alpha 2 n=1 Tax=Gorilla gorilla gorilla TaxID=9595 RepID=A0A2I2Y927_GORGO